jgi:hypothetical protein
MSCPDENVLWEYFANATPSRQMDEVQAHLESCSNCRALAMNLFPSTNDDNGAPATDATAALEPRNTAVGRYIVLEHIGSGGMGMVYAAYDPELDRKVALKLIRADRGARDVDALQSRLLREAQAMARVAHPNVVHVYDVGLWNSGTSAQHEWPREGQQVFVAMEYVDGGTLRGWLRAQPRHWQEVLAHFIAAGRGLAAAHAAGLVHRDFKPDNVLLGSDGRARVTDFGLVHPTGEPMPSVADLPSSPSTPLFAEITDAGVLVGTPAYMAPEQLLGDPCDARTDLFSFCVALYEGLYGERPFCGGSVEALAAQIARGEVRKPPPSTCIPMRLRNVVLRGLSATPAARPQSMDALLSELGRESAAKRRRWLKLGLLATLLAAAIVGWLVARRAAERVCQGGAHKLDGIWDPARKERVRESFAATRSRYADVAVYVVSRALDRASAAWLAMYTDACQATRVRGEQSEELLDLRMECLEDKRRELGAATELLDHADAEIVEKAAQVTAGVGLLQSCADTASLRAATRPPADPLVKQRVAELRDRLAAVAALKSAAKYEAANTQALSLLAQARTLGYGPVIAEAQLLLGRVQRALKQREAAKTLRQTVIAAEATHQDRLAAEAWIDLANVDARMLEAREAAEEDMQHAEAYLTRLGPDDALRAELSSIAGQLLLMDGKIAEARAPLQLALAAGRRAYGEEHPRVAYYWEQNGFMLTQLGDKPAGEVAARRGLAINEKLNGPDHPDTALALIWLGAQLETEHKDEETHATFRRAIAILEKARGPMSTDLIMPLGRLADSLAESSRPEDLREELELHLRAVDIGRKHDPKSRELGYELGLLAGAYVNHSEFAKALAAVTEAESILEPLVGRNNGYFAWLVLSMRGQVLHHLHRDAEAIPLFAEALRNNMSPGNIAGTQLRLAKSLWAVGHSREGAISLAKQGRDYFQARPEYANRAASANRWLATHSNRLAH